MVRLFNIDIPFHNSSYPALVSIREEGPNLCCQVRYIDKRLHYILPGDMLVFNLSGGLMQPVNLPGELAEGLVRCTTEAISKHLEPNEA